MLTLHLVTEVRFEQEPEWSTELHEHLLRHVEKRMKGNTFVQGQAEVVARGLVDKEMGHLVSTNSISYVKGCWVFARKPCQVIALRAKG